MPRSDSAGRKVSLARLPSTTNLRQMRPLGEGVRPRANAKARNDWSNPPGAVVSVGAGRFELPTSRTRTVRATKLRYAPRLPPDSPDGRGSMKPARGAVKATRASPGTLVDRIKPSRLCAF